MTPQKVTGIDQRKDRNQNGWWFRWLDDARRDLRHAARLLWSDPLFSLTATLSLAIGIGANTTVFTLADALLFQPAPGVAEPDRLVDIGASRTPGRFGPSSYLNYVDIRQRTTTLDGVYAYSRFPLAVTLGGIGTDAGTAIVFASIVTVNYFTVLGAVPAAGRLLSAAVSEAAGASPVVLSYRCWIRRFNGDPGVVGRSVTINGAPFTVIGVAAGGFRGTGVRALDLWVPINMVTTVAPQGRDVLTNRAVDRFLVGGRLKPGASLAQAAAEMDVIGKTLEHDFPEQNRDLRLQLLASSPTPGNRGPVVAFLALLVVIVTFVLIVACANVAGILLARANARRREMALRVAIGAGRSRLIRQLLTESLLLFVLGGTAGLLLARALTSAVAAGMPELPFPVDLSLALNTRVVAFTCGISLVAAVLCGLGPALQASKADVLSALNNEPRFVVGRLRLRYAFVVGQVTFSIVLVIVAGLFVRALQRAATIDLGFNPHGVEIAAVDLAQAGYTLTTGPVFAQLMVDRLRALPDVQSVTVASGAPGGIEVRRETLDVPAERGVDAAGDRTFVVDWTIVSAGYFATLRTALVAGREFTRDDRQGAQPVAIVSEAAARQFWPGQHALGKYVLVMTNPAPRPQATRQPLLVVGVARDMQLTTLVDGQGRPSVYVPLEQHFQTSLTILARTTHGQRIAEETRILLRSMNPNVAIMTSQTLDESIALGLTPQRIAASVSGALGLVGLLLAGIGIYGVTAYVVTRRTREIGIRIALGARRGDIVTMILREGLSLTLIGSVIGFALAALISQALTGFLFGVPPIDPVTFVGTTLLFVAIGVAACYRPLRRAMCINPTQALRYE
jgi:predicted permease